MRITLFVTIIITVFLVQACSKHSTKAEVKTQEDSQKQSDQVITKIDKNNLPNTHTFQIKPAKSEQLTIPETQIIRELYHAGCLIEAFELDRRKQNMRISCAKDTLKDNSRI